MHAIFTDAISMEVIVVSVQISREIVVIAIELKTILVTMSACLSIVVLTIMRVAEIFEIQNKPALHL